jgi:hypothetical protein
MKKKLLLTILALFGAAVLAALGYAVSLWFTSDVPSGKFASYEFFPHDKADVLEYHDGKVMIRTCCGDSAQGTYAREPDGRWIWTFISHKWVGGSRFADPPVGHSVDVTKRFLLRQSPMSLRIENLDDPAEVFNMPRRFLTRYPL